MSYNRLVCQTTGHVMIVSITGPVNGAEEVASLSRELSEMSTEITWDEGIRVILFADHGQSFSIGGPVSTNTEEKEKMNLFSLAEPIARLDKPVIVAINGDAIGIGLELALACDIRIASEGARFGLPQIKSGLIPRDGGTQRLSRLVGRGKALEMILTGEVIHAQEALRIGLVHKVVPKKDLTEVTMKMAQEMAPKGPIALKYAKEAIYKGMDMTLEQGLRLEADLYLLIHTSKDRTEGIQAFREKRAPKFEGK